MHTKQPSPQASLRTWGPDFEDLYSTWAPIKRSELKRQGVRGSQIQKEVSRDWKENKKPLALKEWQEGQAQKAPAEVRISALFRVPC